MPRRRVGWTGSRRSILTASGGPFLDGPADLSAVTPEQALRHPTWSMGAKITIDSATLANKGLEVVEARWLYDVDDAAIDVVVHPQSVVHSAVRFVDGSLKAQLGTPDMRTPIQYALTYPDRRPSPSAAVDLIEAGRLDFRAPDEARFPALAHRPRGRPDRPARHDRPDRRGRRRRRPVPRRARCGFNEIPALLEAAVARFGEGADQAPGRRGRSIALDARGPRGVRGRRPSERLVSGPLGVLVTIALFIIVLGSLVLVHELGHFLMARLAGVRVLEFGIGFPPRAKVLRSEWRDPLHAELAADRRLRQARGRGRRRQRRSRARSSGRALPVKLIILVAGVAMNLVVAFLIFTVIAWLATPFVGLRFFEVQPGSPAAAAGLQSGDAILGDRRPAERVLRRLEHPHGPADRGSARP